jgi:hypothetical protein
MKCRYYLCKYGVWQILYCLPLPLLCSLNMLLRKLTSTENKEIGIVMIICLKFPYFLVVNEHHPYRNVAAASIMPSSEAVCPNHASQKAVLPQLRLYPAS